MLLWFLVITGLPRVLAHKTLTQHLVKEFFQKLQFWNQNFPTKKMRYVTGFLSTYSLNLSLKKLWRANARNFTIFENKKSSFEISWSLSKVSSLIYAHEKYMLIILWSTLLKLVHHYAKELWAIMSYNKSYFADLSFGELEDFSPNLKGWRQYFFIGVSMIAIVIALIVQKAIYKSLKNLGPRPIKEMIIPSQVSIFYSNYHIAANSFHPWTVSSFE